MPTFQVSPQSRKAQQAGSQPAERAREVGQQSISRSQQMVTRGSSKLQNSGQMDHANETLPNQQHIPQNRLAPKEKHAGSQQDKNVDSQQIKASESSQILQEVRYNEILTNLETSLLELLSTPSSHPGYKMLKQQVQAKLQSYIHLGSKPTPKNYNGFKLLQDGRFIPLFIRFLCLDQLETDSLTYHYYLLFEPKITYNYQKFISHRNSFIQQYFTKLEQQISQFKHKNESRQPNDSTAALYNSTSKERSQDGWRQSIYDKSREKIVMMTEPPKSKFKNAQKMLKSKAKQTIKRMQMSPSASKPTKKPKSTYQENQIRQLIKSSRKSTAKKDKMVFEQGNQKKNNGEKKDLQQNNIQPSLQKLGSVYHYQLVDYRDSPKKGLIQVRHSARLQYHEGQTVEQQKFSKSKRKSAKKAEGSNEEVIAIDWLRKHLNDINVSHAYLYQDYRMMTQKDLEISRLLKQIEEDSDEEQDQPFNNQIEIDEATTTLYPPISQKIDFHAPTISEKLDDKSEQQSKPRSQLRSQSSQMRKKQTIEQHKAKQNIDKLPLTIEKVIEADLNQHGIYALLQLGKLTEFELGTKFALTPLTNLAFANKRYIVQDLQKAKEVVRSLAPSQDENIGYIQLNSQICKILEAHKGKNISVSSSIGKVRQATDLFEL